MDKTEITQMSDKKIKKQLKKAQLKLNRLVIITDKRRKALRKHEKLGAKLDNKHNKSWRKQNSLEADIDAMLTEKDNRKKLNKLKQEVTAEAQ